MAFSDLSTYSPEQVAKFILEAHSEDIPFLSAKLSDLQLTAAIEVLKPKNDKDWQYKLVAIIQGIQSTHSLEVLGGALILPQVLTLLDNFPLLKLSEQEKILPILVGLPHLVFMQLLMKANEAQLTFLKHASIAEPIQHQLTVFCHELSRDLTGYSIGIENLASDIDSIDLQGLSQSELIELIQQIKQLSETATILIEAINRALLLAWNTLRIDLISNLSDYKELLLKMRNIAVGKPGSDTSPATGIYLRLQNKIDLFFNVEGDPLSENEPAMEALAKLSVWYLKDYWEIGLLPGITDSEVDSLKELQSKEELFAKVNSNLKKLGLSTVKDLKQKKILSRASLEQYIKDNQALLT
jgi:hypothetical protein